ncbi:MAG: serine/threonine protein kinase, partial [Isosphaeraceae bacterium]|nr:serine/threonine protein kinase [Isosphaeraceae bacterium]
MSSVFRAVHLETGHVVALKVLPRTLAKNPTFLQRFLREAKSAEALEDPNIVAIYDRGVEDGRYYLVLEYVPGGDLHDWVRDRGPLPAEQVVEVLKGVARGLRHAASRGMIHRDIKPANLLRTEDGRVKITDLGLALQLEEEDERVTRDGTTVGTVDYMAPEQARDSRATSVRSDIYSLGCTAFYLLTGQPPFAGGDVPSKLRRHALEPPPDPRSIRPEVPPALARLVLRMMAKKPEERFADHDDLLAALDRLALGAAEDEPVLTALIDEEDEPIATALIDEDDEEPPSAIALIDEDESSDFVVGRPGTVRPDGAAPVTKAFPPPGRPAVPAEIDLIELAAIEEDEDRPAARPAARPRPVES